jgi:hypothetical protein
MVAPSVFLRAKPSLLVNPDEANDGSAKAVPEVQGRKLNRSVASNVAGFVASIGTPANCNTGAVAAPPDGVLTMN